MNKAAPTLAPSSVLAFKEALDGPPGMLDGWLECNDEDEVKVHILALLSTTSSVLPSPTWCASVDADLAATEAEDAALSAALLVAALDDGAQLDGESLEQGE